MKKICSLLVVCGLSILAFGQIKEKETIDSIFMEWDRPNAPGCALGIIEGGELIYARGYGMANLEYDIPIDENSIFRIASTSKQFTAACIVLLAEKGKLSLDDKLCEFFPDFPDYDHHITVRHLLHHTSGIRDYLTLFTLKGYSDDDYYKDTDVMKLLVNQKDLNFDPGSEFLYSNSGYWLLGQIVNQLAGKSMADFAKEEILNPLGMVNTHFHNDHNQIVKKRASGYRPIGNASYKINMTTLDMIGDGGIFTSISDMLKWDNAFYFSEVFTSDFWSVMTTQGVLNNGDTIDYASGLYIGEYKGLKTIRHGGAFVGFRSDIIRFPEQKFSVVVFANRSDADPTRKCYQIADIMLSNYLSTVEMRAASEEQTDHGSEISEEIEFQLNQVVGTYEIRPGYAIEISIQNDSLNVLQKWDKSSYNLIRIQGNTFQLPGDEKLAFTFSEIVDGSCTRLLMVQNGRETACNKIPTIDLYSIKKNEFMGKYYSEELDVIYDISIKTNFLVVTISNNEPQQITPYGKDQFSFNHYLLNFERHDDSVTGFRLDAGRVKNLFFRKL